MKGEFRYFLPDFFYSVHLENHLEIKEELMNIQLDMYKPWSLCPTSTSIGKDDTALIESSLLKCLWDVYDSMLQSSLVEDSYSFISPTTSSVKMWMNVYEKGDFQEVHNHIGRSGEEHTFSFAYLLHDESETGLCFRSSNPNQLSYSMSDTIHTRGLGISEGNLIIFPSYFDHYVLPSTGKRITVSGNIVSTSGYK